MTEPRKVPTTISVDESLLARLKELSLRTKVPMAVYWREAMELLLVKHETKP